VNSRTLRSRCKKMDVLYETSSGDISRSPHVCLPTLRQPGSSIQPIPDAVKSPGAPLKDRRFSGRLAGFGGCSTPAGTGPAQSPCQTASFWGSPRTRHSVRSSLIGRVASASHFKSSRNTRSTARRLGHAPLFSMPLNSAVVDPKYFVQG
jgi:hypothetical protein